MTDTVETILRDTMAECALPEAPPRRWVVDAELMGVSLGHADGRAFGMLRAPGDDRFVTSVAIDPFIVREFGRRLMTDAPLLRGTWTVQRAAGKWGPPVAGYESGLPSHAGI